jgi:hypothetical protein
VKRHPVLRRTVTIVVEIVVVRGVAGGISGLTVRRIVSAFASTGIFTVRRLQLRVASCKKEPRKEEAWKIQKAHNCFHTISLPLLKSLHHCHSQQHHEEANHFLTYIVRTYSTLIVLFPTVT